MQKYAGWKRLSCFQANYVAKLWIVILSGLAAGVCHSQQFASPIMISGDSGSYATNNSSISVVSGGPSIAGQYPNAPVWFEWTASHNGDVELDTVGSELTATNVVLDTINISGENIYTVLGVYTGTNAAYLNQIAANNQGLYPIGSAIPTILSPVPELQTYEDVTEPYYGPSHLHFTAQAGVTYYFAMDTVGQKGPVSLTWAYQSSGVFRFATEDVEDRVTPPMPLYQVSQSESASLDGVNAGSAGQTYYSYNAPGLLVTVTRVAGSQGRVSVNYNTQDGSQLNVLPPQDLPAYAYYTNIIYFTNAMGMPATNMVLNPPSKSETNIVAGDYSPVQGTLVFDDGEMSKTILVPINSSGGYLSNPVVVTQLVSSAGFPIGQAALPINTLSNTIFGIHLSNPQVDSDEIAGVSQPRVDPIFSTAMVKILNANADPYGPDIVPVYMTNITLTATNITTNYVDAIYPTNEIFNFEKTYYRVPQDVNDPAIGELPYGWTRVLVYVERFGTNTTGETINYRVNNELDDNASLPMSNNEFPLQPGSDYAIPNPPVLGDDIRATNDSDFDLVDGTITFPAGPAPGYNLQSISFDIPYTNGAPRFNKDFRIDLYRLVNNAPVITGMNAEATVTVLFNDEHPPAGSVDEFYNADFNDEMATLPSRIPATSPGNDPNPGVGSAFYPGEVYAILALTNDEALIGGDFPTYNGTARSGVALIQTNGQLDTSFNPGSGVSGDITEQGSDSRVNAAAASDGEYYIGGNFTAYNNTLINCLARLNAKGQLDSTFNIGTGANNTVRAVAVQPNGEILVGGDFTNFNGAACNYLTLLNTNGAVDTNFNETAIEGPVYSIAVAPSLILVTNVAVTNNGAEVDQPLNITPFNSGTLTVDYNMTGGTNDMRIYYGNYPGTGALIYDTGIVTNSGAVNVPFGPGLNTSLTIVMNQGGTNYNTQWTYRAAVSVSPSSSQIYVGGNFTVAGQIFANIARLNSDGSLDTYFNPGTGLNGTVHTLGWQLNNEILVGGEFNAVNGVPTGYITRFNPDGTVDPNFFDGTGADNVVYNIGVNWDGSIYVGGAFDLFNGSHRRGFTRLYSNGTVDTTFMDTAYNQFAGLKRIFAADSPAVFASAIQYNSGILIGGSFLQVGGGQANPDVCNSLDDNLYLDQDSFGDPNLWVEPKSRDGVRNRTGFARLIGGSTQGPGNIGLAQTSISQDKSQSPMSVALVRTNGTLGPISANFSVQPELAQAGRDYTYQSGPPLFWVAWNYIYWITRMREDGLWGISSEAPLIDPLGLSLTLADASIGGLANVNVNVIANQANPGNVDAQIQLANPSSADTFYLGGENIPVSAALGVSAAPLTLIDDTTYPGQFGFTSTNYIATNALTSIAVVRSNGTFGVVSMRAWATNNTAIAGVDYRGVTNQTLVFNTGITKTNFNVTILNNGSVNNVEKTINLALTSLGTTPGATFGISNAILRIINPNYPGYVTLAATNFGGTTASGVLNFVVNRTVGSLGLVTVQYATTNGVGPLGATNGVDYIGSTNTLTWNSGDVSPRIISIPLLPTQTVGIGNKQFGVMLFNPMASGSSDPTLMTGSVTNALLVITNNNSYGTIQFSPTNYLVDEFGGYAALTLLRTGGSVGTVSVHYATADGTALANTTHGSVTNYIATNGVVVFAPGQTTTNIIVPIVNDGVVDPANFYFNVNLSSPVSATLGSKSNAWVNILDVQSYNQPPGSPDTSFNTEGMNGSVYSLSLQPNGQILAGGGFTAVGTTLMNRIARLNVDGTLDTTFLNGMDGANASVNTVVCQTVLSDAGRILVGGAFNTIDNQNRFYIARLMSDGSVDTSFNPGGGANASVNAIAESFTTSGTNLVRNIYIGGAFTSFNGNTSPGVERLNNNGTVDYSFNIGAGADGPIYSIAVYPTNSVYWGKVLIGGAFAHINGVAINNLARLNSDGSLDTNYNAGLGMGPNGSVNALAVQEDGKVLIGGNFTTNNSIAANSVARLNTDGSLDTNFIAATGVGANGLVQAIAVQTDGRIMLVGQFTSLNGFLRNHIARLLSTGAVDPSINFGDGANGDIDALAIQSVNNAMFIGGTFSEYDGQPEGNIAEIYGGSETGSGQFEFTSESYSVQANAGFAEITIQRTGGTSGTNSDGSGDALVDFYTTNLPAINDASNGVDYEATNEVVSFPPGAVFETVTVPVFATDNFSTTNLVVGLGLTGAPLGNQPNAILTIINPNSAVSFLSPPFYTVDKNVASGLATINLIRQGSTNGTSSVDFYTTTNGTALIGTDYTPTNEVVTFLPGVSQVPVQVSVTNNGLVEGNQTVTMALSNAANTSLISPTNATLTIIDTTPSPGILLLSTNNYFANKTDPYAYVTIIRTNGTTGSVSVGLEVVPGTAQTPLNYINPPENPIPVGFADGQSSQIIGIQLSQNNLVQGTVSFSVVLTNVAGGAVLAAPTNATVSIINNVNTGVEFTSATNIVDETNGTAVVLVEREGFVSNSFSVNFATTNGSALAGVNYTATSGTLTFATNAMFLPISVNVMDQQITSNLTFGIALSSPTNAQLLTPTNTVVELNASRAGLFFTNSAMSIFKNSGIAVIPVICNNPNLEPVVTGTNVIPLTVNYSTANGTAIAGQDYNAENGTLTFTNGLGTNYIFVPILNNSLITGQRTFTVSLANATAPGEIISPSSQVVTIIDSNSGLSFSQATYTTTRSAGTAVITVVRTDNTNVVSSIAFATANGTAMTNVDYFATNGILVFTNGIVTNTFSIQLISSTTVQPDKTVLLQLTSPGNGILIPPSAATLTIHDTSGSLVVPAGSAFTSTGNPNGDGLIDPGETVSLYFAFRAEGGNTITNLYATLLPINGVTAPTTPAPNGTATQVYSNLFVDGPSESQPFTFTASGTNGQQIAATFALMEKYNGSTNNLGTNLFTYTLGMWTMSFTNTNAIVINPEPMNSSQAGMSTPYPSIIAISNIVGTVFKTTITLTNLTHTSEYNVNALLLAPSGSNTLFLSHAGTPAIGVNGVTLTFSDTATNTLPYFNNQAFTNGVYKPAANGSPPAFP